MDIEPMVLHPSELYRPSRAVIRPIRRPQLLAYTHSYVSSSVYPVLSLLIASVVLLMQGARKTPLGRDEIEGRAAREP
jgi:hypothetical protein